MSTIQVSPRILLYEAGGAPPQAPVNGIALPQRAGTAFGDGRHPTTRLCAGAVDFICRQRRPQCVLDVGSGTGVLARIARARGAGFIVGTDIDPTALSIAQANAELDSHPIEILWSDHPPDHWGSRFDLVVANILEEPLRALAPRIVHALLPGGTLLLSGFTRLQIPALRVAYELPGMTYVSESFLEEWSVLMLRRDSVQGF
jgi:ribosomal protein L11 methyltransferase